MLSILLPSYNNVCLPLVNQLREQAEAIAGLHYEIIVADDGGENQDVKRQNEAINLMPHCRYIQRQHNVGRAAIRNFLASQAHCRYMLFMDSDVSLPSPSFLSDYLHEAELMSARHQMFAIDGGVCVGGDATRLQYNLRYRYEKAAEPHHRAANRRLRPYEHFHTANFLCSADVFCIAQFDARITRYGYEDVLFGKQLQQHGVAISHIECPVCLDKFESNARFLAKTETALETLHCFRAELKGYSIMLDHCQRLQRYNLLYIIRAWHWLFGRLERHLIANGKPRLWLFKLYKVGHFLSLK